MSFLTFFLASVCTAFLTLACIVSAGSLIDLYKNAEAQDRKAFIAMLCVLACVL